MRFNVPTLTICAMALLAACSSNETATNIDRTLMDQTLGGVVYQADTRIMESFPVQLRSIVTVENRTSDEVTITLPDGCAVLLRAYRTADRTGDPAWDESRAVACTMALQEIVLAPGAAKELTGSTISAAHILGDSLPAGRYYLTAVVRPNGQLVEMEAGEADLAK